MTDKIRLVQGNTRPNIVLTIKNLKTGVALDLSDVNTVVRLKLRAAGSTAVKATLNCIKLVGAQIDGEITTTAPYAAAGSGGRVYVVWTPLALDTAGEFEGEVEATFADTSVQTVYEILKFKVRKQF